MRAYRIWANLVGLGPFRRPLCVCVPDAWCTCRAGERRPRLGGREGGACCVCVPDAWCTCRAVLCSGTHYSGVASSGARRNNSFKPSNAFANAATDTPSMDFTLTANANGPSDPNNIVLRGADPLYSLPVAHPLRRAGFNLQSTPGGLNASLDNALSSEIEAALVPALRPDAALRSSGFILRPPTPQKLQAVLLQLGAEPPPHRLNLSASYPSLSAFASAVALTHESSAAHYKIATAVIWSYCVLL